jgi:pyruvate kinase
MVSTGMNVARINFSHGTPGYNKSLIDRICRIRQEIGLPVAILMDLQGPKIRIGAIGDGQVELSAGNEFTLTTEQVPGDDRIVSVSLQSLADVVSAGDPILIADGNIELKVEKVVPPRIHCRVVVGGLLSSKKGVNLPGASLSVDAFTAKDRADLAAGMEAGIDAIALSFVRSAMDVEFVRKIVRDGGQEIPLVAKVEKHEAVGNIEEIISAADAVMVARGDLGVEIPIERVPLVQKSIIRKCNAAGKPVITATQMLARMVDNPRPTRAEATDVANAVLDGTDAVMLSEETAVGQFPMESLRMLDRIVQSAESALDPGSFMHSIERGNVRDALSRAACEIARDTKATAILALTWSGATACLVSRFRPPQTILAATPNERTCDFLSLSWGVTPILIPAAGTIDDVLRLSLETARRAGLLGPGDRVVITGGVPVQVSGNTNLIKVETIG